MASTFFGLNIGKSGLYAYQIGINTTAHNVANAETAGYTRQIVNKQASQALSVGSSYGMVGTGVDVTSITQVRSKYLDEKLSFNATLSGEYSTKSYYMTEIESYFNEVSVEGFTTNFDNLYNALQTLSTNPSNGTTRTQVTTYAANLTEYLNSLGTSLNNIQEECNTEVKNIVDRINSIAQQVSVLTQQINSVETNGEAANDLRDQRALLIDELSEYVSVDVTENKIGASDVGTTQYIVKINGQTLVDTNVYNQLQLTVRSERTNVNDIDGLYDIQWESGVDFNIKSSNVSGSLKAVFEMRDGNNNENLKGAVSGTAGSNKLTLTSTTINDINKLNINTEGTITIDATQYQYTGFSVKVGDDGNYVYEFTLSEPLAETIGAGKTATVGEEVDYKGIPYYMSQLNEFVRVYAKNFNDIHKSGIDLNGDQGLDFFVGTAVNGTVYKFNTDESKATAGTVLFDSNQMTNLASYYQLNISNIGVNQELTKDSNKVVTYSSASSGIENTDVLKQLVALKSDTTMFKQGSPASFFQTMVAEIGVNASTASSLSKNQEDICKSIENQRLSISGVDVDEEALNLVKYQNCYNLSSKVISVMDELLDRLINYTGV